MNKAMLFEPLMYVILAKAGIRYCDFVIPAKAGIQCGINNGFQGEVRNNKKYK